MKKSPPHGFTLIELLVVVAIIAILSALSLPLTQMMFDHAHCSGCVAHMRSLDLAFTSYANDHDSILPGRVEGAGDDKWPTLLLPYVTRDVYADPGDPLATQVPLDQMVSNTNNHSSYFFNGFNDLGSYTNPSVTVGLANITATGRPLILLGQKVKGSDQFYMDFVEGNEADILNKTAYFGGSNYAFSDGSVQFLKPANYDDTMWLVDKTYPIPPPPGH